MPELLTHCPACKQQLDVNDRTDGDWTSYHCGNHGNFKLSKTLSVMLVRNPELSSNVGQYLENTNNKAEVICTYDVGLAQ